MSEKPSEQYPLLRRPLYFYDLPEELLYSLTVRSPTSAHNLPQNERTAPSSEEASIVANEDGKPTSCAMCHSVFHSVQDQRQHVKSDFHRYNLKLSMKGMKPLDEATFVKLIGDLDESISGSDSSDSDTEEEGSENKDETVLSALLKRQAKLSQLAEPDSSTKRRAPNAGNAPMIWLSSPKLGEDVSLGFYKALLSDAEKTGPPEHLVDLIKRKQVKPVPAKQSGHGLSKGLSGKVGVSPHFFLCMIGGGHFAAMVVSLAPEMRRGPGGVEERHAVVMAHKTFHRYTTRRKQGGSQSANDNAKGNAHSAGSSIRRYNEAALEADVRGVLAEWKDMINTSELWLVRATGTTNRRTLFGPYDGQVLRSNDPRLRGFPFSTRRATQAELLRSFSELTRLKVSFFAESTTAAAANAETTHLPASKTTSKPKVTPPKLSKEEETAALHTSQLQALIRRSRAPAVLIYLSKNELSPDYRFYPAAEHHHARTPLHLAASTNSSAVVLALLTKAMSDPTIANGDGKTPYEIAGDQKTRDTFRVARHQLGEENINWAAAHVPIGLSAEEVEARNQQEKAIAEKAEADRRKSELIQIANEEKQRNLGRMEKKAGAGKTLGAVEKTGAEKREEEARGLTPEMRQRLERERRARAAEDRMRRIQGTT